MLVLSGVMVVACTDREIAGPTLRSTMPFRTVMAGACLLRPHRQLDGTYPQAPYFSYGDPDTVTICGVKFTMNALDTIPPDQGYVWWRPIFQVDSFWLTSGDLTTGTGLFPVVLTSDFPVTNLLFVWQFDPEPGSAIVLYDSAGTKLDSIPVGNSRHQSPWLKSVFPDTVWWTKESHISTAVGVRKIRLNRSPSGSNHMYVHVFFDKDTICPPVDDSLLNSATVIDALFNSLSATRNDTGRVERGGGIYRDTTAMPNPFFGFPYPQTAGGVTASDCQFPMQVQHQAGLITSATWHTHGRTPVDAPVFTNCARYASGTKAGWGPSSFDFIVADSTGLPHYVLERDYIYRIQPNAVNRTPGTYERRWRVDNARRCFLP